MSQADSRWDRETSAPRPGFRWCPECNGEGVVWTMSAGPNLDESSHPCTFPGCSDGEGIVPDE